MRELPAALDVLFSTWGALGAPAPPPASAPAPRVTAEVALGNTAEAAIKVVAEAGEAAGPSPVRLLGLGAVALGIFVLVGQRWRERRQEKQLDRERSQRWLQTTVVQGAGPGGAGPRLEGPDGPVLEG
jgi:hypothetical protein